MLGKHLCYHYTNAAWFKLYPAITLRQPAIEIPSIKAYNIEGGGSAAVHRHIRCAAART